MDKKIALIKNNDTWRLVPKLSGKNPIGFKWIYSQKNAKGEVKRYKAILVAKGYSQKHEIDYNEVFALVSRLETIRLIIVTTILHRWKIYQIDVKSAFLNGFLEEEVYIKQRMGFEVNEHKDKGLKLNKALYELKQTPRAWYSCIDDYFLNNGFVKYSYEYAIYVKIIESGDNFTVCLYMDDLIFTRNNSKIFGDFKQVMIKEFKMKDICLIFYYLGIEIKKE